MAPESTARPEGLQAGDSASTHRPNTIGRRHAAREESPVARTATAAGAESSMQDGPQAAGKAADAGNALRQPLLSAAESEAAASATHEALTDHATTLLLLERDEPSARHEARKLLKLAWPMMFQNLVSLLLGFMSTTFVGHLNDPLALSAVVMASSIYAVSGVSITFGLVSAMDTLCGQAFGARNFAVLRGVLLRARAICWTTCLPIALMWWFIEPLLVRAGQNPELARLAATNLRIMVPSLFMGVLSDTTRRYLISQRVVVPTTCCCLVANILLPVYNYFFIFRLKLRTAGAAWATTCCNSTAALLLVGYQLCRDHNMAAAYRQQQHRRQGCCFTAFKGWQQYLSMGLPAAAMVCLEWWVWELLVFSAGLLPDASVAVGVMGLCIQIANRDLIPSSLGAATGVRVANLLGAGQPHKARAATRASACLVMMTTMLLGLTTYLAHGWVVHIFTQNFSIRAATAAVLPAVAASIVGNGMVAVLSAVLRASGRQAVGAAMNVAGYWVVCLPLAWFLGFHAQLGVLGFWLALAISTTLQATAFGILISRFNWQKEVKRAAAIIQEAHQAGGA